MATPRKPPTGGTVPGDPTQDLLPEAPTTAFTAEVADASVREAERVRDLADAPAALPVVAPPPDMPPGFVLYENVSQDAVRFTVRDSGNKERLIKCAPGKKVLVGLEYASVIPDRAPQLREVTRTPHQV